jgi:hypothetical protein
MYARSLEAHSRLCSEVRAKANRYVCYVTLGRRISDDQQQERFESSRRNIITHCWERHVDVDSNGETAVLELGLIY